MVFGAEIRIIREVTFRLNMPSLKLINDDLSNMLRLRTPPSSNGSWRRGPPRIAEVIKSTRRLMGKLPTEILLGIAQFLPPESVACLTLASNESFKKIGTEYLEHFEKEGYRTDAHYRFLALRNRDQRDDIICFDCILLRLWRRILCIVPTSLFVLIGTP